jgi:hypothetical protein
MEKRFLLEVEASAGESWPPIAFSMCEDDLLRLVKLANMAVWPSTYWGGSVQESPVSEEGDRPVVVGGGGHGDGVREAVFAERAAIVRHLRETAAEYDVDARETLDTDRAMRGRASSLALRSMASELELRGSSGSGGREVG